MKTRLVFKTNIARQLLKMGYRIVDLKPARTKNGKLDFTKTIYVFADENGIAEKIAELIELEKKEKVNNSH